MIVLILLSLLHVFFFILHKRKFAGPLEDEEEQVMSARHSALPRLSRAGLDHIYPHSNSTSASQSYPLHHNNTNAVNTHSNYRRKSIVPSLFQSAVTSFTHTTHRLA